MFNSQGREQPSRQSFRDQFGTLYWALNVVVISFVPFIRYNFGAEGIGFEGFVAMMFMFMVTGLMQSPGILAYTIAWLVVVGYRRVQSWRLEQKGLGEHSFYSGRSYTLWIFRHEGFAKTIADPIVCFVTGLLLAPVCQPVGAALTSIVPLAMVMKGSLEGHIWRMRARRMRDASIEQRHLARALRR